MWISAHSAITPGSLSVFEECGNWALACVLQRGHKTAAKGAAGADRPGDERRCVFLSKVRLCS